MGAEAAVLEGEAATLDGEDEAALFAVRVAARIEDHAVAGLEAGTEAVEFHPVASGGGDLTGEGSAFFGEASVDEALVIDAVEPAGEEAAAEGHGQVVAVLAGDGAGLAGEGGIDGLAVDAGDGGDVFRRLEAAFDFEAADAEGDEFGDFVDRGEVLG